MGPTRRGGGMYSCQGGWGARQILQNWHSVWSRDDLATSLDLWGRRHYRTKTLSLPSSPLLSPLPASQLVANYLDPVIEALAYQDCLAVSNISSAGQFYVTQLQNGTLYNVKVITSNIFYDSQLYEAGLKTVDLTPPVFVDIVQ